MFTVIITIDDFVYFLTEIKKQVFESQHGHTVPLGFVYNIQMVMSL